jgi:hypothetical protein
MSIGETTGKARLLQGCETLGDYWARVTAADSSDSTKFLRIQVRGVARRHWLSRLLILYTGIIVKLCSLGWRFIPFGRLGAMVEFDYNATAELFATRKRSPRHRPFGYKRFAQAADAIRFAIEDLPAECLVGAFLEVDEQRYGSDDIRRLYESTEYPLNRRAAQS